MAKSEHDVQKFNEAVTFLKVQGILSLVFGGLGSLASIFFMLLFGFSVTDYNSYQVAGATSMILFIFVFALLPHIYLVISGIHLLQRPTPRVAKALTVANLVIGVFWNLVILIFAILSLTQVGAYEANYTHKQK